MKEFIENLIGRLEKDNRIGRKSFEAIVENINELAEEYKGGCCEWEKHRDYWESKCDYHIEENWFPEIFSVAPDEYHCPYCGKKIKVV
jgi:hypothetical protein